MHINPILRLAREILFNPDKSAMMSMPDGFLVTDCKALIYMKCPEEPPVPVMAVGVYELASDEVTLPAARTTDRISYDFTDLQLKRCKAEKKIKLNGQKFSKEYGIFMHNCKDAFVQLQFSKNGEFRFKGEQSAWILDKEKIYSESIQDRAVSLDTRYARFLGTLKERMNGRMGLYMQEEGGYMMAMLKAAGEEPAMEIYLPCAMSAGCQAAKPVPRPEPKAEPAPSYEAKIVKLPEPKDELPHIPAPATAKIVEELKTEFALEMRKELKAALKDLEKLSERIVKMDARLDRFDERQAKLEEYRRKMQLKLDEAKKLTEDM